MKSKYHIPYTLDSKFGDAPVQMTTRSGDSIGPEDLTIRPFLVTIFSILIYIYLIIASPFSQVFMEGSWLGRILFTLGYGGLIYFALREISVPGLYGYHVILPFINYISTRHHRDIRTGDEQLYLPVSQFVGMHEPDNYGRLHFNQDNKCGQLFKITGSASHNTFEVDRVQTINEFANFLKQLPNDATVSFATNTGGQNVNNQIYHLLELYDHTSDRLISAYIAEEVNELAYYVQDNFVTLHQYMLIIGDDPAALKNAVNRIQEFAQKSGFVISSMSKPSKKHNYSFFQSIYGGIQDDIDVQERLAKFKKDHTEKSDLEVAGSLKPDDSIKKPESNISNNVNRAKRHRKIKFKKR